MPKLLLRLLVALIGTGLCCFLLRGPIYRSVVHYEVVRERGAVPSGIQAHGGKTPPVADIEILIQAALDTTSAWLHFSTGKVLSDPRLLTAGSPANCVGYSALCAALLKSEMGRSGLTARYQVQPVVAQLFIGHINLHAAFRSPFWKDHDIVRVRELATGHCTYLDPTLYGASGIGEVRGIAHNTPAPHSE